VRQFQGKLLLQNEYKSDLRNENEDGTVYFHNSQSTRYQQ